MKSKIHVKTPTILQMEAVECGAAALGIILAHFKHYVSLEELRISCGVSRDGSKAINMLRAARQYGLKAEGARVEIEALPDLNFPFIAFWEFNHFVVVEGYSKKKIYLNDPATGPRSLSYEEFSHGFTGVILLFEPSPVFETKGKSQSLYQDLHARFIGIGSAFFFIVLASLFLVVPGIAIAGFARIFIDEVLIHQHSSWLLPFLWGMILTAGIRGFLSWLQQIHMVRLQLKLALITSAQFFWHVLHLPLSFFSQRFVGDISSRVAANDRIATIISSDLGMSLVGLISMVFYAVAMILYDSTLTGIGIFFAFLNASLLFFLSRLIANAARLLLQENGQLSGIELFGLQTIETLKATGQEDAYFQRWAGYHAKTLNNQQRIQLYDRFLTIIPLLLNGLLTALILGVGSLRIIYGSLTVGGLIGFQSLLSSFNEPLNNLLHFGSKLQEIQGDFTRLHDVLRHPEEKSIQDSSLLPNMTPLSGNLELKNLSFGYSLLEPPLLEGINFSLFQGKSLAIIGASGCGKSTLAKLIVGLYAPWTGDILLDCYSTTQIPRSILSKTLAFVDQDIFLFEGTFRDNITLWDDTLPHAIIEQAIADAELGPLLATRPGGLASFIEVQGSNISGGQRQQLEIARALVTQPNLLILDEATASLDPILEAKIIANLKQRGCSLLVVAHRLSTIRSCDEVLLLAEGKIVAHGSHESLSEHTAYKRLLLEWEHANE